MFSSFGWPEALIVLAVVLIVFGAGKLPQVGGALGKSIREFQKGRSGLMDESEEEKSKNTKKSNADKESADEQ